MNGDKRERIDSGYIVEKMVADVTYEDILGLMYKADLDLVCDDPKHGHAIGCYSCQDRMQTFWDAIQQAARDGGTVRLPKPLLHRDCKA